MKKLLIVDDSSFMRLIMKHALSGLDIELIEAKNGQEALEKYSHSLPDLVTMDITMPDIEGVQVLESIKKSFPDAKVIMCSSMVYKENIQETFDKGAIDFLKKPFSNEELVEMIKKHLY